MPRRVLQGVVISDRNDKTVVVRVDRRFKHPLLKKTVRASKKYHAHDEENAFRVGDQVRLRERAPVSKLKRWDVISAPPERSDPIPADAADSANGGAEQAPLQGEGNAERASPAKSSPASPEGSAEQTPLQGDGERASPAESSPASPEGSAEQTPPKENPAEEKETKAQAKAKKKAEKEAKKKKKGKAKKTDEESPDDED